LAGSKSMAVGLFLNQVRTRATVDEAGGWLTVRPLTPASDREKSVRRDMLGSYVRERLKFGRFSLVQSAEWALKLPRANENAVPSAYVQLLLGASGGPVMNEDLLRFYGGLSPKQRLDAASEDGQSLSGLGEESSNDLNRMVFGFGAGLTFDIVLNAQSPSDFDPQNMLSHEPTEAFANGFPSDSRVRISGKGRSLVGVNSNGRMQFMSVDQLSSAVAMQSRPDMFPNALKEGSLLEHLHMGQSSSLEFVFDFGSMIHLKPGALEDLDASTLKPVAYGDLPAEFRKQLEDQIARKKEIFASGSARAGGGAGSPPPR